MAFDPLFSQSYFSFTVYNVAALAFLTSVTVAIIIQCAINTA